MLNFLHNNINFKKLSLTKNDRLYKKEKHIIFIVNISNEIFKKKYFLQSDNYGPIVDIEISFILVTTVIWLLMQGDLEKQRYGPVIMTIHNVGSSYRSMVDFINHPEMLEVKNRYIIVWDIYVNVLIRLSGPTAMLKHTTKHPNKQTEITCL